MAWVRFWHRGNCPSGINSEESDYQWFDEVPDEASLKEDADERVPYWRKDSERGYKYGFEILTELPEKIRLRLISDFRAQRRYADKMLGILGPAPPGPKKKVAPKPKTAWDRVSKDDPV